MRRAQTEETNEQRHEASPLRDFLAETGDDSLFESEVRLRPFEGGCDHFAHGEFLFVQRAAALAAREMFLKGGAFFVGKLVVHGGGQPGFDVVMNVVRGCHGVSPRGERRLQALAHGLQGAPENAAERAIR